MRRRLALTVLGLVALSCAGLAVGPGAVAARDAWAAIVGGEAPALARVLVWDVRLPRALAALVVGASLGAAGAMMQGLTRNPLAGPGLMGLNAGGALAMLAATLVWPALGTVGVVVATCAGAALGACLAFGTAALGRGRPSHLRLALAGVVVTGLLQAVTGVVVLYFGMSQDLLAWTAGGISGVRWGQLAAVLPVVALGGAGAVLLAPQLTHLALGTEVATGLGLRVPRVWAGTVLAVLALTAGALALAGPVAYVGLLVPHLVRRVVGVDYRAVVPASALAGALVVLLADLAGRSTTFLGAQVPLGLYTALVGSVGFVLLARGRGERGWPC
jgi:iron complex transport system permease protein